MSSPAHQFRFVVDAAHQGLRFDTFLSSRLRNYSPARFLRLARAGLVRLNDLPCGAKQRVRRGNEVSLRLAEPPEPFYPAERCSFDILYDDPWLVVINKPTGTAAHPAGSAGGGTVANGLQDRLDRQTRFPGLLRPGIVHRLDRQTSGAMLVPKDALAHASLTRQFERGEVRKEYCALLEGHPATDAGTIDRPIGVESGGRMTTARDAVRPRAARTDFRVLRRLRSTTLIVARPATGRKHQIRVHCAAMGHPVVGDAVYGRGTDPSRRWALHAVSIGFRHPVSGASLRIIAPIPSDFWETLAARRSADAVVGNAASHAVEDAESRARFCTNAADRGP